MQRYSYTQFEPIIRNMRLMAMCLRIRGKWLGLETIDREINNFDYALDWLENKAGFKPTQPRIPAGNPDGGQWTGGGSGKKPQIANPSTTSIPQSSPGWGNRETLPRHMSKHGSDFSTNSAAVYTKEAQKFYDRFKIEKLPAVQDRSGIIRIYDPKTNTFGAYNPDGSIRTFYKPEKGAVYFEKQIRTDISKGGKIINPMPTEQPKPSQKPSGTRPVGGRGGIFENILYPNDPILDDGGQVND